MKSKCYKYKKAIYLLDLTIPDKFSNIDLMEFKVPEDNVEENYWQVPYMEQFFDVNEDLKICETYNEPDVNQYPTRVLFFLFESSNNILKTPYGDVELSNKKRVPSSIKKQIDFEPLD